MNNIEKAYANFVSRALVSSAIAIWAVLIHWVIGIYFRYTIQGFFVALPLLIIAVSIGIKGKTLLFSEFNIHEGSSFIRKATIISCVTKYIYIAAFTMTMAMVVLLIPFGTFSDYYKNTTFAWNFYGPTSSALFVAISVICDMVRAKKKK